VRYFTSYPKLFRNSAIIHQIQIYKIIKEYEYGIMPYEGLMAVSFPEGNIEANRGQDDTEYQDDTETKWHCNVLISGTTSVS